MIRKYRENIVFIGLESEWKDFIKLYQPKALQVWFFKPENLLEAAEIIAGSELFIGNQSCCYAIAEGLKHNTVQETDIRCPDCIFTRANAQYVPGDTYSLPDLK